MDDGEGVVLDLSKWRPFGLHPGRPNNMACGCLQTENGAFTPVSWQPTHNMTGLSFTAPRRPTHYEYAFHWTEV